MIKFKKNGRPTKSEKGLVKSINNLLSSMDESDLMQYDFRQETVTDGNRLSDIWTTLQDDISKNKDFTEPTIETVNNEQIDTNTGEVIEEANIKEEKMEDATIIEEISGENNNVQNNDIPLSFNPLSEPIKERSYNKKQERNVGVIEEPDFTSQPTIEEEIDKIDQSQKQQESVVQEDKPKAFDSVTNEAMNDLDPKDKKAAAKALVQTVLDGYEMLHELGKRYVQYDEGKLQEKIIKGEIDPTEEIPIDEMGGTTNVIDFFKEFNEQAVEAISYSPEFGDKVRAPMERVFAKKGWGMTDEQFLLVAFGKDIGMKTIQIMTLKKTANSIMDTFVQIQKEKIEAMANNPHPAQSVSPDSIVTPPQEDESANPIYQRPHNAEEDESEYEEVIQE